jgi:YHS domain-containing protein
MNPILHLQPSTRPPADWQDFSLKTIRCGSPKITWRRPIELEAGWKIQAFFSPTAQIVLEFRTTSQLSHTGTKPAALAQSGGMNLKRLILILVVLIAIAGISGSAQPQKCNGAIDPVCGLCVERNPKLSVAYKGETYYFCTDRDANTFRKNPAEWVKK